MNEKSRYKKEEKNENLKWARKMQKDVQNSVFEEKMNERHFKRKQLEIKTKLDEQ